MLVCLNELRKFVPEGESEIPVLMLSNPERADRVARAERYQRAWMDSVRERCLDVRARHVADLPRIETPERRVRKRKVGGL